MSFVRCDSRLARSQETLCGNKTLKCGKKQCRNKETMTEQHRICFNTYQFIYCPRPTVCRCAVNLVFLDLKPQNGKLERSATSSLSDMAGAFIVE